MILSFKGSKYFQDYEFGNHLLLIFYLNYSIARDIVALLEMPSVNRTQKRTLWSMSQ